MVRVITKEEFELHRRAKMLGGRYDPGLDAFILNQLPGDTCDVRALEEELRIPKPSAPSISSLGGPIETKPRT